MILSSSNYFTRNVSLATKNNDDDQCYPQEPCTYSCSQLTSFRIIPVFLWPLSKRCTSACTTVDPLATNRRSTMNRVVNARPLITLITVGTKFSEKRAPLKDRTRASKKEWKGKEGNTIVYTWLKRYYVVQSMRQIGYKQRHNKYSKTYCAAFTRTSDGTKLNILAVVFILENDTYLYVQKERNFVKTFLLLRFLRTILTEN